MASFIIPRAFIPFHSYSLLSPLVENNTNDVGRVDSKVGLLNQKIEISFPFIPLVYVSPLVSILPFSYLRVSNEDLDGVKNKSSLLHE